MKKHKHGPIRKLVSLVGIWIWANLLVLCVGVIAPMFLLVLIGATTGNLDGWVFTSAESILSVVVGLGAGVMRLLGASADQLGLEALPVGVMTIGTALTLPAYAFRQAKHRCCPPKLTKGKLAAHYSRQQVDSVEDQRQEAARGLRRKGRRC